MITFAVIGYGRIGERHARLIEEHPDVRLAGAFDIQQDRLKIFHGIFPDKKVYSSFEEVLADDQVQIVSICTPNYNHASLSIEALQHGKHVLVEKPMAISREDCARMIEASLASNKSLFVVKQNRFNPPVQAVKNLLEKDKLGRILSVAVNCYWNRSESYYRSSDWKGIKALDGGTLFTQFSHFIDILYYFFGDIEILYAHLTNANHAGLIEFEDTGVVTFLLKSHHAVGVIHYTTNAFHHNMEGSITIFAERATIKIGGPYLNKIVYEATDGFETGPLPESNPPNQYGDYEGSMSNHERVIDHVIRSLQGDHVTAQTNIYDALKTVEIIENIYNIAVHDR